MYIIRSNILNPEPILKGISSVTKYKSRWFIGLMISSLMPFYRALICTYTG